MTFCEKEGERQRNGKTNNYIYRFILKIDCVWRLFVLGCRKTLNKIKSLIVFVHSMHTFKLKLPINR